MEISLPNKFHQLIELVLKFNCVDILVITEIKPDYTFPTSQFVADSFSEPFRFERNRNGGGIKIFVRGYIPSKPLQKHVFPVDIEDLFIKLNFRKCKCRGVASQKFLGEGPREQSERFSELGCRGRSEPPVGVWGLLSSTLIRLLKPKFCYICSVLYSIL